MMRLGALDLELVRLQIKGKICFVLFKHFRVVSQNRPPCFVKRGMGTRFHKQTPWIVQRFVPVSMVFHTTSLSGLFCDHLFCLLSIGLISACFPNQLAFTAKVFLLPRN
jgi:hypothetical protein